jgi:hypothetical protein
MAAFNAPFDDIEMDHIKRLVDEEVQEQRTIEYKEKLPDNSDEQKNKYRYVVSSLANTVGGYIFYGIRERRGRGNVPTGKPEKITGLQIRSGDQECRRLEQLVRQRIDPRLSTVRAVCVSGQGKTVIVVRVGRSISAPHGVGVPEDGYRFYTRNSSGRQQMDVLEIRNAFIESESPAKKIERFARGRVRIITDNAGPVRLIGGPKIVVHAMPLLPMYQPRQDDIIDIAFQNRSILQPSREAQLSRAERYNLAGFVIYPTPGEATEFVGYTQVFRNGVVESVGYVPTQGKTINAFALEKRLIKKVKRCLDFHRECNVEPPIVVLLTLIWAKNYSFFVRENPFGHEHEMHTFDRPAIHLPETIIEEYISDKDDDGKEVAKLLRSALNVLWQSVDYPKSEGFDTNGEYQKPLD